MHKLMEYICDELDELERKAEKNGKLTATEVQYGDTLAHFKKNLLKAEEMADGEYSMAGGSYGDSYARRGGYSRDGSYARGMSYARGRTMNVRRDSMGRYSRDGYSMADNEEMLEELRGLMQEAPDEQTKQEFRRFIQKLEKI